MFLGLPDPDPLVRGADLDPNPAAYPSLFSWMSWADWNIAWQNRILNIFLGLKMMYLLVIIRKKAEKKKIFFNIIKVIEDMSRIRS